MTCPRCQQENPPQAKFCLECATPLARQCVSCGTPLPVMGKLLALDEALKPTLSALLALLDVPVDDAAWRTLATSYLEQARGHLTTATAMYREMDMRFWLEQAEAESKELGA